MEKRVPLSKTVPLCRWGTNTVPLAVQNYGQERVHIRELFRYPSFFLSVDHLGGSCQSGEHNMSVCPTVQPGERKQTDTQTHGGLFR